MKKQKEWIKLVEVIVTRSRLMDFFGFKEYELIIHERRYGAIYEHRAKMKVRI